MTLRELYKLTDGFSLDHEIFFDVTPTDKSKTMILKSIDDAMEIETDKFERMIVFSSGVKNIPTSNN